MNIEDSLGRRKFLTALGATAAAAAARGEAEVQAPAAGNAEGYGFPSDLPRVLQPTGNADLGTLFADVNQFAQANQYPDSFTGNHFRNLEEFKSAARHKVFDLLLYRPAKVDPNPKVVDRTDEGDYVREKIVFSTGPMFRVPAYVLIPKKLDRPAPAIVDLHSHGGMFLFGKEKVIDFGRNHPAMVEYHKRNYEGRPTATALVRRGYVVMSIDAFFFGERRLMLDTDLGHGWDRTKYSLDDVKKLNLVCRGKEGTLVQSLIFAGLTWPGIVFWDDIRTVDYISSRPEVDPKQIGCIGISMGGYRSAYLAGLDERIKAACVTGFMSSIRPMIRTHVDRHSWVHYLSGLHRFLDLPDVASMAAPRALMVQQCRQDRLFPPEGMQESVDKIAAVYKKAGISDQFAGKFYDAPHQFLRQMQEDAFAWFDRHLKAGQSA